MRRNPQFEVVIPPRATAQPSAQFETDPTTRDWRDQRTVAAVTVAVLNRMLAAGRPDYVRTSVLAA